MYQIPHLGDINYRFLTKNHIPLPISINILQISTKKNLARTNYLLDFFTLLNRMFLLYISYHCIFF